MIRSLIIYIIKYQFYRIFFQPYASLKLIAVGLLVAFTVTSVWTDMRWYRFNSYAFIQLISFSFSYKCGLMINFIYALNRLSRSALSIFELLIWKLFSNFYKSSLYTIQRVLCCSYCSPMRQLISAYKNDLWNAFLSPLLLLKHAC